MRTQFRATSGGETGHEGNGTVFDPDLYSDTIAVAIAEADGEVGSLGTIANREESIPKLVKILALAEQLRACYEAGSDRLRSVLAV